ncbi:hypothetical protein LUZ62_079822 [Rhynchospora pubera]|uniref:DUF4220 domain-containing protein n=1 Tax=Rhynchospora pubera TaxID=906938 RepID=A0AAV8BQG0_9POAL|nr:hypothetical protein LUZ62_079822 [Rhynchospora pubera]
MVTLQYSISAVRPSGICREQKPLKDMMTSLWTANLLGTKTTKLKAPLWLLWSLNSVRLILGFVDSELASTRQQRNVYLITEYMRNEHKISVTGYNPQDMKGYKYLVWGEDEQKVDTHAPEYRVQMSVTKETKFFTMEKIWEEKSALLDNNTDSKGLKDLCLSFAWFKLLRRRFLGLPLYEARHQKTKDLVNELLKDEDYDRAFRIIKLELAFITDFYYTRFGSIFANGFPILRSVLSVSVVGICIYLLSVFGSLHVHFVGDSETDKNLNNTEKVSNNLILIVTWILVVSLMLKELWEIVTYVVSDWTKIIVICNSFQKKMVDEMSRGKLDPKFKLAINEVKRAISNSVRQLLQNPNLLESYLLSAADDSNLNLEGNAQISSAGNLIPETRKILVWHIATCYCEITLLRVGDNAPKIASLNSPFILENLGEVEEGLESHYKAAVTLSQYTCHLLNLSAPLVPDHILVTKELFQSTQKYTRESLRLCDTWFEITEKLNHIANEADDIDEEEKGKTILKMGVRLGKELTEVMGNNKILWKFLEKFWSGHLLYVASSINPADHKDTLSRGGEFVTHVWALLSHAGILGRYG